MPGNIVLIGFSGTGKSSVGRILAQRLGWQLIDTDQRIVERFGKPIGEIFRDEGERVFRSAEAEAVATACGELGRVISVGGGAPVDPANRVVLKRDNLVVRLEANAEVVFARLRASPNAEERPMLAGADPLTRIRELLDRRAEAYSIADVTIDTENRAPDEVAAELMRRLSTWRTAGGDRS